MGCTSNKASTASKVETALLPSPPPAATVAPDPETVPPDSKEPSVEEERGPAPLDFSQYEVPEEVAIDTPNGSLPRPMDAAVQTEVPDRPLESARRIITLCMAGDALELLVAPGDVLYVRGSGNILQIGTVHGMMGHVMLILAPPIQVLHDSPEGRKLEAVWPDNSVEEVWKVRTLESTSQETGLWEAEALLFVDKSSGGLVLCGEIYCDDDGGEQVRSAEREPVELWQSPMELRRDLRVDLMQTTLKDMKTKQANWSAATAARAVMSSAIAGVTLRRNSFAGPAETLEFICSSWSEEPICTSVVIVFWQRYLMSLALSKSRPAENLQPLDLIFKWMPLKADRGLPTDLLATMRACGWVQIVQVPRVFRRMPIQDQEF